MKETLESYGFAYAGTCKICSVRGELFQKGNAQCKVLPMQSRFILTIAGKQYRGKSEDLKYALEKYLPA